MKLVRFILKFFGGCIGIIITVYTVALYIDLTLKSVINRDNIKKLVNDIDLIDDSQKIFKTEDRIVERTINDIELGNLTYEDKKQILYKSELYSNVGEYLTNYVYYFIGYEEEKYIVNDEKINSSKKDLEKLIKQKTDISDDELVALNEEIDKMYKNLENINLSSLLEEFPEEYKIIIDYVSSKGIIYIEIILLVVLLIVNALLMRNLASPFKWLSIGLFFSLVMSIILKFILSKIEVQVILFENIRNVVMATMNTSVYIVVALFIISVISYILLQINHKNKAEDALGKTQINIENINIK